MSDISWSVVESFDDLNEAVSAWNSLFVDVANCHAPIKKLRLNCAIKPWITKDLKEITAERGHLKLLKDWEMNKESGTITAN